MILPTLSPHKKTFRHLILSLLVTLSGFSILPLYASTLTVHEEEQDKDSLKNMQNRKKDPIKPKMQDENIEQRHNDAQLKSVQMPDDLISDCMHYLEGQTLFGMALVSKQWMNAFFLQLKRRNKNFLQELPEGATLEEHCTHYKYWTTPSLTPLFFKTPDEYTLIRHIVRSGEDSPISNQLLAFLKENREETPTIPCLLDEVMAIDPDLKPADVYMARNNQSCAILAKDTSGQKGFFRGRDGLIPLQVENESDMPVISAMSQDGKKVIGALLNNTTKRKAVSWDENGILTLLQNHENPLESEAISCNADASSILITKMDTESTNDDTSYFLRQENKETSTIHSLPLLPQTPSVGTGGEITDMSDNGLTLAGYSKINKTGSDEIQMLSFVLHVRDGQVHMVPLTTSTGEVTHDSLKLSGDGNWVFGILKTPKGMESTKRANARWSTTDGTIDLLDTIEQEHNPRKTLVSYLGSVVVREYPSQHNTLHIWTEKKGCINLSDYLIGLDLRLKHTTLSIETLSLNGREIIVQSKANFSNTYYKAILPPHFF